MTTPAYQRERGRLAEALKALRVGAGLSGARLAEMLGWQQSKVSKIQTRKQLPGKDTQSRRAGAVGATPEAASDLLAMLRGARVEYAAWKDTYHESGAGGVQADILELEARRPESPSSNLHSSLDCCRPPSTPGSTCTCRAGRPASVPTRPLSIRWSRAGPGRAAGPGTRAGEGALSVEDPGNVDGCAFDALASAHLACEGTPVEDVSTDWMSGSAACSSCVRCWMRAARDPGPAGRQVAIVTGQRLIDGGEQRVDLGMLGLHLVEQGEVARAAGDSTPQPGHR